MSHVDLLTRRLEDHDPTGVEHAARVTHLALLLAALCGSPRRVVETLRAAGPLHDIGKLEVDPAILAKPTALDPAEVAEIKKHPLAGARLVLGIRSLQGAIEPILHHHERWDGAGYPHGLGGAEIPEEARILAVADAYDAMTSDRPYRDALTHAEAVAEVERCAGTQFDPLIADAFLVLDDSAPAATASTRPRASSVCAGSPRR
jgi:HD-GYP domain-containing protein (c-di-GMP phosphodiesterase class II)